MPHSEGIVEDNFEETSEENLRLISIFYPPYTIKSDYTIYNYNQFYNPEMR